MIAYLQKYDTTVEVPDDIGEDGIADLNSNFHSYVDQKPSQTQPDTGPQPQSEPVAGAKTQPEPAPRYQPNFYESTLRPALMQVAKPVTATQDLVERPEAQAFAGKVLQEGTFGLAKPLTDNLFDAQYMAHPNYAAAGQVTGAVGSLLVAGGALRAAGLAGKAAEAGKLAVEAGMDSGERFIPRAIMSGATFGTRTFVAQTVKAFQDGGVDLEKFGKDVLKDTAFGSIFGAIGGLANAPTAVASAGGLGFLSSKMDGADNREASLNASIWAAFETVGSFGRSTELRLEALGHLKESMGEYAYARDPNLGEAGARRAASNFVDNAMRGAGYETAEDIAKAGPEHLLEGLEKVNKIVRRGLVPMPEAQAPKPNLPALPGPETGATEPSPTQKAVDAVTNLLRIPKVDVEQPKGEMTIPEGMEKTSPTPAGGQGRWTPDTGAQIGEPTHYLDVPKSGDLDGAKAAIVEKETDQGESYYQVMSHEGDQVGGNFADLKEAQAYAESQFRPTQDLVEFARQHQDLSDHDVAQMAYNRGLIDEPNKDLLRLEIQKAKQEGLSAPAEPAENPAETKTSYSLASPTESPVGAVKESINELRTIADPTQAAPLAAQITRENLGKMARSYDMAEAALDDAKKYFDSQPKEANLDFIDKMERGQAQSDVNLGKPNSTLNIIARQLRDLLDSKRKEIQSLGTGKMQSFIENYFPHIWDQGEGEVGQVVQKAAKRPFEGSKSFLKKRKIEFTKDGIDLGLTPMSYNPVDLALLKVREMDKYLMAHKTIKSFKAEGLAKYVKIGGDVPDGWTKIDDRISTVFKSPMVAVKEAYDQKMMDDLNAVAKNLGIDLERSPRMKGEGKKLGDVWGLSMSNSATPGQPGKIFTRFAGPESALAHELGHQLDHMYGLQAKFLSDPKIESELTDLANQRISEVAKARAASGKEYQGEGLSKSANAFKKYVQQPEEKMAAMLEAYIHAPELLKEIAPNTYAKLHDFLKSDPKLAPLTEVKPSLVMGVNESEVYAGGAVISGHIYAQPDAARIINNYLSPGLQKYSSYRVFRYAGNLMNQFQLGFSAFHLGFTSLDASVSKFALAVNELAQGHPLKAVENMLRTPFAAVENILRGDQLLKAWRGKGRIGADDVLAQAMASAGGRARMDQFYATRALDQMKHNFQAGNLVRGVLHVPLMIAEMSSKPILEWIVPRQKLGVFADMMKMELENNPNMTHSEMRQVAQRAWDSVDNRMGQLVYDNLFWNRTFKDLLMASVRSVGWNLGTIRELAGGGIDYAKAVSQAVRGKKTEFTYRMAYFTALPIVVGTLGAMIQYLRTGKGPQELKDYFYPKTGGIDSNGDPHRIALPSYMKDLYHWKENPVKTATDKLHPIFSMLADMYQNKDYYGIKTRNEDDPLVKQVASEVGFILKQFTAFSIRNMQKNMETENKSLFDVIGPWVGITPAPYDIDQTDAEKKAHEIMASKQEIGGRTQEQVDRSRLVNDLTRQYRRGDPNATANIYKAYQEGRISHRQMGEVISNAQLTPLQKMVKGMTLQEAQRVYRLANDEEKVQINNILQRKLANQERQFVSPPLATH